MAGRPLRIITAVAAYDGHDASTLALNRALLALGEPLEIIYLGYHMTAEQIARAAIQESADAVAVASYNGGHLHFYPQLLKRLAMLQPAPLLFGGGGATILASEQQRLEAAGLSRIYLPGTALAEIAADMVRRIRQRPRARRKAAASIVAAARGQEADAIAELLLCLEHPPPRPTALLRACQDLLAQPPAAGSRLLLITGAGGSGKSTLIDELVQRFLKHHPRRRVAVLANDPAVGDEEHCRALLADRVRMNAIYQPRVFLRSLSSGAPFRSRAPALPRMSHLLQRLGFDLVIVETPGSGQAGLDLKPFAADLKLYLKTREYGSGLQLQKDQLLLDADLVVLNKIDQQGAEAAYRELQSQLEQQQRPPGLIAVMAKTPQDQGLAQLFRELEYRCGWSDTPPEAAAEIFSRAKQFTLVPHARRNYLADIVARVRSYDHWVAEQLERLRLNPHDDAGLDPHCRRLLDDWPEQWQKLSRQAARHFRTDLTATTANGLRLPRVALPDPHNRPEALRFLLQEGLPGSFPYVSGLHPLRPVRGGETTRQFAGLRNAAATNRRLHLLARGVPRPRLSIAFDGITLYGDDSDADPSSIGKIGEGGVAIDSWEDMKSLLKGFSIRDISTSLTINGPAPVILAMYFVAAAELEREALEAKRGRPLSAAERERLQLTTWRQLRGTVQADILKELQAQNECILQPEFAIRLLGDVQQFFIEQEISRFYSLSISGYHIGEAGASPVQEMAFTLANGFTYVENFLARRMPIDRFAPNLSFFFRVSHEAEWLAYGAVCRKIWAIAMRDRYGAGDRSQQLRFHSQTSGRALQAEEWDTLNPLRQTCHALLGLLANSNSLHVDAADEPMTTPSEKYVRQATMIPNFLREESELFVIQNLLSGSYAYQLLLKEVQQQVLEELLRIDQLGGVGPATELGYQRHCIAEQSARYERQRQPGAEPLRPIIGYNAHQLPADHPDRYPPAHDVVRPAAEDAGEQIARIRAFRETHRERAPQALKRLQQVAAADGNTFAELLQTVRCASLGQITQALIEVGGRYRKML